MPVKCIVTLHVAEDAQTVRATGCELLAEYPDSLLAQCSDQQYEALQQAGLEVTALVEQSIQISGASFSFSSAVEADDSARITPDPNRTAYYLVKLIGPVKGEWLRAIEAHGAAIYDHLADFTMLVGALPGRVQALQAEPWVEAVTPYRAAMRISPALRSGVGRELNVAALAAVEMAREAPDVSSQVEISVFPGESTASVAARIRESDGVVLAESQGKVTAIVSRELIGELANEQGIRTILPHRFPRLHNNRATPVMGIPDNRIVAGQTLRGSEQIVAIADSGLDTGNMATVHADFAGRIVDIVSFATRANIADLLNDPPGSDDGTQDTHSAHGTHVAGSVLGSGAAATAAGSTIVPRGVAPEARLYFQAIEQRVNWKSLQQLANEGFPIHLLPPNWPPPASSLWGIPDDLNDLFTPAYTAGARIHTNSWGSDDAGVYAENSRAVDEFMWHHRDMLILFSAGNEGVDNNSDGVIDLDSIGSPGTAKNCLTVGASENDRPSGSLPAPPGSAASDNVNGMARFSSRGPTDDGRLKPDVVAPGTNVLSARSSAFVPSIAFPEPLWGEVQPATDLLRGLYCWSGGTSMSTPLVAGAAALVRQHLVQQRGHVDDGVKPSGALIKAFLVNGAVSMAPGQFAGEVPAEPSNVNGFGRVNLTQTLISGAAQTQFADEPDDAVETGEVRTFFTQVLDTAQPLKVTLVWTDAPGAASIGGLQNELYLQVMRPDGGLEDGDVNPFPNVTNNVQQVVIDHPVTGTYEIRVRGVSVTMHAPSVEASENPRQDFALAVSNAVALQTDADASEPAITNPVPNSVLPGSTTTFEWTVDGAAVAEWWLYVGSGTGEFDFFNSGSLGTSLSRTVAGLPTDGSSIFVRLWFRIGADWDFSDVVYTAATFGDPALTSPTPGSVLPGSDVTFEWDSRGTSVTEWWIYIGSASGSRDLLNSGSLGTSLALSVTGVPTDGRSIFVRLWFRSFAAWDFIDFSYDAAGA